MAQSPASCTGHSRVAAVTQVTVGFPTTQLPRIIHISLTPHSCSIQNANRTIASPSWTLIEWFFSSDIGVLSEASRCFVYVPQGIMIITCACHSLLGVMVSLSHCFLRPQSLEMLVLCRGGTQGWCNPVTEDRGILCAFPIWPC